MNQNIAIISIGSNLDAEENIKCMLEILGKKVSVLAKSQLLKTKPIGIEDQPEFINGAVKIATSFDHKNLKLLLKSIEDELGRDRTAPKFGPRTMDLDIVVWNGDIVDVDYYTRDFLKNSVDELIH